MQCWLQSNVKDVVRLIARLLWGTKVGVEVEAQTHLSLYLVRWHRPTRRMRRPRAQMREGSSVASSDGLASLGVSRRACMITHPRWGSKVGVREGVAVLVGCAWRCSGVGFPLSAVCGPIRWGTLPLS